MVKHTSIWRLVAAITAGGLICAAVYWSFKYRRMDREFLEWGDARPLDAAVDLSRPGKVTARFHQTCQVSHGEEIYLAVKPAADRSNSTLLQGLDGVIRINDIHGKEIHCRILCICIRHPRTHHGGHRHEGVHPIWLGEVARRRRQADLCSGAGDRVGYRLIALNAR